MEEDASYSTLCVREELRATADIPTQLPTLSPVTDASIDDSLTRSRGTEHIKHRPSDAILVEHSAVSLTSSRDVEWPFSTTLGLPIGMLFPLNIAVRLSEQSFFRQNLILRFQPQPLVAHLVHGMAVLLSREK